jgi:superfamily I DNA and RNA helicase
MLNIIKSKLNSTYKKKPSDNINITIYNKDLVPAVRN